MQCRHGDGGAGDVSTGHGLALLRCGRGGARAWERTAEVWHGGARAWSHGAAAWHGGLE